MSTIQIADKTTLDNTKTNTTNLLTKGGIKYNATSQKYQTYNTTNSSWVDTEFGGGGGKPTIIIKNEDGSLNNISFTVSNTDYDYSETKNMGSNTYLIFEVPMLGEYTVSWSTKSKTVDVNTVGGIIFDTRAKLVSFADGTDAEIADMLEAYYNDEYTWEELGWAVGDTRVIHLDVFNAPSPNSSSTWLAQDITVVIVDHDHTTLETPINGHTKACITVQTKEVLSGTSTGSAGTIYVDGSSSIDTSFKKWGYPLYMRTYLNDKVWGAFQTDFKALIKPSTHYRHTTYDGTASEQVTDNLFLPSYPEIYGTKSNSSYVATSPTEGTQFDYYKTSANRVKYTNNNGVASTTLSEWWTGSASYDYQSSYGYYWCFVYTDGSAVGNYGGKALTLAPAFAM